MTTTENERRTADSRLAATLVTSGAKLLRASIEDNRAVYAFEMSDIVEETVQAYMTGKALVEPKGYSAAFSYMHSFVDAALAEQRATNEARQRVPAGQR